MSYEYKELIEQAIIDDDRPLDWEEGFKELDEVYARAQAFEKAKNEHEFSNGVCTIMNEYKRRMGIIDEREINQLTLEDLI